VCDPLAFSGWGGGAKETEAMAKTTNFPNGVTNVGPGKDTSLLPFPDPTRYQVYFNDFHDDLVSWTETATSVGTGTSAAAIADAAGGILRITTAANEDDGLFIKSQGESFVLAAGKRTWLKARFALGKAAQSDFILGLHTSDTTPLDATDRFAFISEDGSAALFFNVDDNTTDADSGTVATLANDVFVQVMAYYDGKGTITLYLNDAPVQTMTGVSLPAGEMSIGLGYLNGEAGAETTDIDYILIVQDR